MIDLTFRCSSRDRWLAVAKARGVIDKDGHSVPGFEVDEIGNAELVPAVLDMKDPMNPTVITVYEFGVGKNAIQLLDPRDYAEVALRQWLGGMSY